MLPLWHSNWLNHHIPYSRNGQHTFTWECSPTSPIQPAMGFTAKCFRWYSSWSSYCPPSWDRTISSTACCSEPTNLAAVLSTEQPLLLYWTFIARDTPRSQNPATGFYNNGSFEECLPCVSVINQLTSESSSSCDSSHSTPRPPLSTPAPSWPSTSNSTASSLK